MCDLRASAVPRFPFRHIIMSSDRYERLASFLLDESKIDPPGVSEQEPPSSLAASSKRKLDEIEGPPPSNTSGCLVHGSPASHNAWRWKVGQHDRTLLDIPRLHDVMQSLNESAGHRFDLRLAKSKLASVVLQHCVAIVAGLSAQGVRFKVGITSDPGHRWFNPSYGYGTEAKYVRMLLIAIVRTMEAATYIEAALIREFRSSHLCDNEAPGGEGAMLDASPGFVYVVRSDFGLGMHGAAESSAK